MHGGSQQPQQSLPPTCRPVITPARSPTPSLPPGLPRSPPPSTTLARATLQVRLGFPGKPASAIDVHYKTKLNDHDRQSWSMLKVGSCCAPFGACNGVRFV